MKPARLTKSTLMPVGLVLTICALVWKASGTDKQVEFNTRAIDAINSKLDRLVEMKTDIEVIRTKVEHMERPVYHTNRDVKSLRREVAQLNTAPWVPFMGRPLGMSGRK